MWLLHVLVQGGTIPDMTESQKPEANGPFGMGRGAWLVLASLFFSMLAITLFILRLGCPSYFGEDILLASAASGFVAFTVGFYALFTQVHFVIKIAVMVFATAAISVFLFVMYAKSMAGLE